MNLVHLKHRKEHLIMKLEAIVDTSYRNIPVNRDAKHVDIKKGDVIEGSILTRYDNTILFRFEDRSVAELVVFEWSTSISELILDIYQECSGM